MKEVKVNVLIITHEEIGSALLHAAETALGELPLPTTVITVNYRTDPEALILKLKNLIAKVDKDQGILVLTDLFGSTPSNIAANLQSCSRPIRVVAGLNLPMLIRVMNYACLDLNTLAEKAISGGKDGVINCSGNHQ